jgi:hypothetical protein
MKEKSGASVQIQLKAVGTMALSTNTTGQIPQAEREAGITRIVRRNPFILELVNVGTIMSNVWEWVEQKNVEGGSAMTAEGAAKSQTDFDLVVASANVKKVTAYIKVTKEMLDDVALLRSEIDQELTELINLRIDDQLLNGTGLTVNITDTAGVITAIVINNAGTGYNVDDTIYVTGGDSNAEYIVSSITNGEITSISINNAGSGYAVNDTVTIEGGNAEVIVTSVSGGQILTATIANQGTGYSIGDVVTITGVNATFVIDSAKVEANPANNIITNAATISVNDFPVKPFLFPEITSLEKFLILFFTEYISGITLTPSTITLADSLARKAVCKTALFSV